MIKKWTQTKKTLFISGVSISRNAAEISRDDPFPDFLALRNALNPDILDIQTIREVRNPLVQLVERMWGVNWAIAFAAFLKMGKYKAVLATGEDVGLNLALLAKLCLRRTPIVLICHNITSRRRAFLLGKLKVGSHIQKFLCLSQAQARILMERYNIAARQIQVVLWAVDHEFFQPVSSGIVHRQICSAGTASRDYATLVQAIPEHDVDVKIAADSTWFPQRLNITEDQLPVNVEARSYGNYKALRQLYAESLFVVVPLRNVDFSAGYSVILEAMAMGKAVIASRIRQQDDFIIHGETGIHVTPGNVDELKQQIEYLLEYPDEAKRLGANARRLVEERFTLDRFVQRVQEAISAVT